MSAYDTAFETALRKKIRGALDEERSMVAGGFCVDYPAYRYATGRIAALDTVLSAMNTIRQEIYGFEEEKEIA